MMSGHPIISHPPHRSDPSCNYTYQLGKYADDDDHIIARSLHTPSPDSAQEPLYL